MAKVAYFLLCEKFLQDNEGRVSLVNVYNVVGSTQAKAAPKDFILAIGIQPPKEDLKNHKLTIRVKITDPKGVVILDEKSKEAKIPAEAIGHTTIVSPLDLGGKLLFDKGGPHLAKLYVNDNEYADFRFEVKLKQKEK